MKGTRWTCVSVALIAVIALVAGCASPAAPPATQPTPAAAKGEPIKIGFFSPLTGPTAADGQSAFNSAKLAVKLINDAGGIKGRPLELINYDDAGKPDQAASIARKLIESDKVIAAISGAYSGPTRAAAPVFQQVGMVMLSSYAIHPDITNSGDKIFRIGTLADV